MLGSGLGLGLVGLGLGLASQASRVYLPRIAIHMATSEASHVYSISLAVISECCVIVGGHCWLSN